MNDFVNECRREWKRLGVSRKAADEMAAELAADLAEAESTDDLLGGHASDPRSLARAWAVERGVVRRDGRRLGWVAAATILVLLAIAGAVLLVVDETPSSSVQRTVAIAPASPSAQSQRVWFGLPARVVAEPVTHTVNAPPLFRLEPVSSSGTDTGTIGLILLVAGLAPLLLLMSRRVALHG